MTQSTKLYRDDYRSYKRYMTDGLLYSRSDLVALPDVTNDALTFWLRSGLLVPVSGGSGKGNRLKFTAGQLLQAAVLGHGRNIGLNIEALRALANSIREALAIIDHCDIVPQDWETLVHESDRLILDDFEIPKGSLASISCDQRLSNAVDILATKSASCRSLVMGILASEGLLVLMRGSANEWTTAVTSQVEDKLPAPYCVIFDLRQIMASLDWWSLNDRGASIDA